MTSLDRMKCLDLKMCRSMTPACRARRRLVAEQLAELVAVEKKMKSLSKDLNAIVEASGVTLK